MWHKLNKTTLTFLKDWKPGCMLFFSPTSYIWILSLVEIKEEITTFFTIQIFSHHIDYSTKATVGANYDGERQGECLYLTLNFPSTGPISCLDIMYHPYNQNIIMFPYKTFTTKH